MIKYIDFTDTPKDMLPGDIFDKLDVFQEISLKILEKNKTTFSEDKEVLRTIKIACLEISDILISKNVSSICEYLEKIMEETTKALRVIQNKNGEITFYVNSPVEMLNLQALITVVKNTPIAIMNLLEGEKGPADFCNLAEDFLKKYKKENNL